MSTMQKRILMLLALADLLVIGGLGWVVWSNLHPPAPTPAPIPTSCPQRLLAALPPRLSPAVSWEGDRLLVQLTAYYTAASPPEQAPQLLWTALDGLREAAAGCPLPPRVILHLTAIGEETSEGYEVALLGNDLLAWMEGEIGDETLAARARYFHFTEANGATPPASPSPQSRK